MPTHVTGSMERAIAETNRRREKQTEYNAANGITPESIKRSIHDILELGVRARPRADLDRRRARRLSEEGATIGHNFEAVIADLESRMREAAADLDFEEAARLRDEVKRLRAIELAVVDDPTAKRPASRCRHAKARASRTSTRWAPAWSSIPHRGRSTLGKPGMRGGFKRKGR